MKISDQTRVTFRADDELLEQLRSAAEKHGRSISAEVTLRLQKSFEGDVTFKELEDYVTEINQRLERTERQISDIFQHTGMRDY